MAAEVAEHPNDQLKAGTLLSITELSVGGATGAL